MNATIHRTRRLESVDTLRSGLLCFRPPAFFYINSIYFTVPFLIIDP